MPELTYQDPANREDLLDMITNLDYNQHYLFDTLGSSVAKARVHEWMTDTLKAPGANKRVEGSDSTYPDRTRPVRKTNSTQIVSIGYSVSDTEREVDTAGFEDRYTYESEKAMKEYKQDTEFALMRGSQDVGDATTAREMDGIKSVLGNTSTHTPGDPLTEDILNDAFELCWQDGVEVNAVYASMPIKRKISTFTSGTTKNVDAEDKRLVLAVDVYTSDTASMVKLHTHRYVTQAGDTNQDLVAINEDYFKIAWLRKPQVRELARTGDAIKAEVIAEKTLEYKHPDAGVLIANVTV